MKTTTLILAALLTTGCLPAYDGSAQNGSATPTGTENTENTQTQTQTQTASLSVAFVSGHLGNTWDCPGEGISLSATAQSDGAKSDAAEPGGPAGEFADCAEEDCGGWLLNCEAGSLVIQVTNTGEKALSGFQVTDLQLLSTDGTFLVDLPVTELQVVMKGDTLEVGGSATLRIQMTAPESNDLGHNGRALLRAIVVTAEDADGEVTSPEVQGLGMIAT